MILKILSLNAHGLNSPYKRKALWQEAKNLNGDVISVQETHFLANKSSTCTQKLFSHIFTTNAEVKKRGTLLVFKNSGSFKLHASVLDPHGRFINLVCDINNITYTIAKIYVPNSRQIAFLCRVTKKVHHIRKGYQLICGDFNSIVDNEMYSTVILFYLQ